MDRIIRSKLIRKALTLVLTLVVTLTFIPLLGSSAYAADEDLTGDIADAILDQAEGANEEEIDVALDGPAAKKAHVIDITDPGDLEVVTDDAKNTLTDESEWNFTVSKSGSTLTINASFKKGLDKSPYGCTFGGVYIDDSLVASFDVSKLTNYRIGLSGSQLNPGYHNVELAVYARFNGGSRQYLDVTKARTYRADITATPNYTGAFEVYSNYLIYAPYSNMWSNSDYDLYLEYSPDGGKNWARSGYMRFNLIQLASQQQYRISGLAPNHNYVTRIRYGKVIDGQLFLGPVRWTGTYKTGAAKKPKIKSVTCKAVKVKRHKVKHYGYYTGVYLYTEKFYTYKVKITVKLKKKPGTAGIWINGKFCKGNKKKYTATFTPYPNYSAKKPKGRKWGVVIASYQNKAYGGYSPLYSKKKKLK